MWVLIYDDIGESANTYGIHESFDTWFKAYTRREELNNTSCGNFKIEYVGE